MATKSVAASPPDASQNAVGQALVDFSATGLFPDEDVSSLVLSPETIPGAVLALLAAKSKLEGEIQTIVDETAEDVDTWYNEAQSLLSDISRRKTLANDILKRSEAPDVSGKTIKEAEDRAAFLAKELDYNAQVRRALKAVKGVSQLLDRVEQAANERRILDALRLLEEAWNKLDAMPVGKTCRVVKLLDIRAFELKSNVHEVFDRVWNALINVDVDVGRLSVSQTLEGEPMSLSDAVIGLKAYKEVDQRMSELWHELDRAIVAPRTDVLRSPLPSIAVGEGTLETNGQADNSLKALFADLEQIFSFLASNLPADLVQSISSVMIPDVVSRIIDVWLDSAVPPSLQEMDSFEDTISAAKQFCDKLTGLKYSGFAPLQDWVESAPRVWLKKRRETALDAVRTKLSQGLGSPKQVEKVEKQMVSRSEGKELTANGPSTAADQQDWDAAWSDEEQEPRDSPQKPAKGSQKPHDVDDDGADAWAAWDDEQEPSGEKRERAQEEEEAKEPDTAGEGDSDGDGEDDPAAAWGWGDEDAEDGTDLEKPTARSSTGPEPPTREMVLKETYNISSMPDPVLALIFAILEDGAILTSSSHESSPVAAAAAGLFSLPTLALAMFRAVAPYYYSLDAGGNMFLYNDAAYLAKELADFAVWWKAREDLSPRAQNMLRLDNEIKSLQSFANRSYSNEMNIQKTILRDLLGGSQNVLQQDDSESFIEAATTRVRAMAATWEGILARSAWYQAVGSLVDAVATKIITDVMEMPSIGEDEAYNTANLIAKVTTLDDLFLPSRTQGSDAVPDPDEMPSTAQYASSWLRLQYLSQVLQSNLVDMRYLWMEGELSLYFTAAEVVDLINQSFAESAKSREVIREIMRNPHPVQI